MTTNQRQFFELVKAGLWGELPDRSLFDGQTDWEQIYNWAGMQALQGVVFDGVQLLPKEQRPPRMLYLRWCNAVLQLEEGNRFLNAALGQLYGLLRDEGIEPVLMKGQGVAQNYRHPLHRQSGDIDIFTGLRDFSRVNELLRLEASSEEGEKFRHTSFVWRGAVVENHRILAFLCAPGPNRRLQREIQRWHSGGDCRKRLVGGVEVTLAPLPFDTVYVLLHSTLHVLESGIGLRQICDWACMLHAQRDLPGKEEVVALLKSFGLIKAARVFGYIAVHYLGLPAGCLPVACGPADKKDAEWLMADIWDGGNFGRHSATRPKRPKGYWRGKWYTFVSVLTRSVKLGAVMPQEARWHLVVLTARWIALQFKKCFSAMLVACPISVMPAAGIF